MPVSKNKIRLPSMTPGTARSIAWLRFGRAGARPKVYIQAAIHANELPGAMALHHLMPMLTQADRVGRIKGELIVVPTVNPIGQSQLVGNNHLGRYDLLSRDNFNRNWLDLSDAVADRVGPKLARNPAANVDLIRKAALAALKAMQPMNELQTMRVEIMKLSVDADVVLDLHCDMDAALHLFTAAPDLKGAAQELAADLGIPVTMYNEPFRAGADVLRGERRAVAPPRVALPRRGDSAGVLFEHGGAAEPARRESRAGCIGCQQPLPLSRSARGHRRPGGSAAASQVRTDAD